MPTGPPGDGDGLVVIDGGDDPAGDPDHGIDVVTLHPSERRELAAVMDAWLHDTVARQGAAPGTAAFFDAAEIAEGTLPERARAALARLRRGAGNAVVLRGLPADASPGPTPVSAGDTPPAPRAGHAWLAMAARRLGHELGYGREKSGSLVHNVFPTSAQAHTQSNASSRVALGLHTENAFHPVRPDYVLLYGVRVPRPAPATHLVPIDDVLSRLSDDELAVLRQRRFTVRVVDSHRAEGERDIEVPLAVLDGPSRRPLVRWHTSVRGTDEVAAATAEAFGDAAAQAVQEVRLEAGDLLAFSNERCLHGRARFDANLDGRDRWLLRAYAVRDLARAAPMVSPSRPGVLRVDLLAACAGPAAPPDGRDGIVAGGERAWAGAR